MSDNWADEATKTSKRQKEERMVWLIDQITGAWLNDPEGLDGSLGEKIVNALKMYGHGLWPAMARIIELERREALLTAVMVEVDAWEGGSSEWWNLGSTDWLEPPAEMKEARRLLAEAGFPW